MEPREMVDPLVVYFKAGDESGDFDCGEASGKAARSGLLSVDFLMTWSPDPPTHYRVRCSLEDLRGKLHALAEFLDEANVAGVNVGFALDL